MAVLFTSHLLDRRYFGFLDAFFRVVGFGLRAAAFAVALMRTAGINAGICRMPGPSQ